MSGAFSNAAIAAYNLAFQVSPIILQGGIANGVLGNALPVIQLTGQLAGLAQGVLSGGVNSVSTDEFFAQYVPIPGGTIIDNAAATYTFANQRTAANALIQNQNAISMLMIAPVKDTAGYFTKSALLTSLQQSFAQHNQAGGWYTVATPARIYGPCLMLRMTDVTGGDTRQQQVMFQIDFTEPLISQADADAAQGSLMNKITNGVQISGLPSWSGAAAGVGSALQGALAGTVGATGLAGAVNQFLSSAPSQ
jgi:hypothetical protein